jgi:uncharacterized membrane protein
VTIALSAICLAGFAWNIATAPWRALQESSRQHGWLGMTVALLVLWNMPARLGNGMDLHLAGASLATLMFGPRLALVSLAIVLAVTGLSDSMEATALVLHGFAFMLLPVLFTSGIQRTVEARLPHHLFIYIFAITFAGTLLANALATLFFVGLSAVTNSGIQRQLASDFLPYRLLLCWGEAMLTGMLTAILLAYRPQWLMSFRDEIYLTRGKDSQTRQ